MPAVGEPGPPILPALRQYSLVDDLIVTEPLEVEPSDTISDVARLMTERALSCAVIRHGDGRWAIVTDADLRRRVLAGGVPSSAPVSAIEDPSVPTTTLGHSAAEALIEMFDRNAEFLLVLDRVGDLRGVVAWRDFAVSSTTGAASLHEQIRRAATVDELHERVRGVPTMLTDLLDRGLSTGRVITVYSAILDSTVRRALVLVFHEHPDLSLDAFTWLSLGSNGRREAVLNSDVDSAVAFIDGAVEPGQMAAYRTAFAQVYRLLSSDGLLTDDHGAAAEREAFARTNSAWRAAAEEWLVSPEVNQGAIMTSLLVDARPIHGDPGLPAVTGVFADLRAHPGTMRLLMRASLSARAKVPSLRDVFRRRETFDIKTQALLPVVNLARWAGLSVGSSALSTPDRLLAAAGSTMLPEQQAQSVTEAFEVLQRLRLRYQLAQHHRGERPSDLLLRDDLSPIERTTVAQAVREIAALQRRMDNVAAYLPLDAWGQPVDT